MLKSHPDKAAVVLSAAANLRALRRREALALAAQISDLAARAVRDDFSVWVFPIVDRINRLILRLIDAEDEGNTRLILRRLRNTLANGGWNRYRTEASRAVAIDLLKKLAKAEEVSPEDAEDTFHRLFDAGLNPVAAPLFGAEEDELPDEEEVPH